MYDGTRVEVGPGTLYAAPLDTTEPTAVTGAWPTGWAELGYTDNGSVFSTAPTVEAVTVEEEIYPVRNVTTGATATLAFSLAEQTAKNLALALNAGVGDPTTGTGLVAGVTSVNPDGSVNVTPPVIGTEVRVMLGWDALPKGATSGASFTERLIARQCFQTGTITVTRQKGNNKALYTCTFTLEKPADAEPFSFIIPASRAA